MEDILASIRRILNEDEAVAVAAGHESVEPVDPPEPVAKASVPLVAGEGLAEEDEVLLLDASMMVKPRTAPAASIPAAFVPDTVTASPQPAPAEVKAAEEPPAQPHDPVSIAMNPPDAPPPSPVSEEPVRRSDLLAPESEAATVSSVGSLLRTLTAERQTQVHRGGPTIEDLVREEIRPLLKTWLDSHLPPLVERLVRAEIERVVGRVSL
jgi:cell pole-organizing protein PopZ